MTLLLRTLEDWTTHQDYFWFLAALAWSGVVLGIWRRNTGATGRWTHWQLGWAAANVGSSLIELVLLSINDRTGSYLFWDRLMSAALAAATASLAWGAWQRHVPARRSSAVAGLIVVAVGLFLLRNQWPVAGGLVIVLVHALAVRTLLRSDERKTVSRFALHGIVLWPLVATHGPLAHATGLGRIGEDYSRFALIAATVLAITGVAAAFTVWQARLAEAGEVRPNLRRHLVVLAVWLAAGFVLMLASGQLARREYEESLRGRARTAALAIDPAVLVRAMGPELETGPFEVRPYPSGAPAEVMHTAATLRPEFVVLRDKLRQILRANPELQYIYLCALRGGRVVVIVAGETKEFSRRRLLVLRPVEPADLDRLASRETVVTAPRKDIFGARVSALSPVYGPGGGSPLGWISLDVPASRWLASFAQARLQTMAIVGVGVVLWGLALAYDMRRAMNELATRRAAAAIEADRFKGAFLATVSHELRTPIQSVLGYGELLAGENLPTEASRWVSALRSHGQVMNRLVNDLIDTGALQSGLFRLQPRTVALRAIVEDSVAGVRPAALAKKLGLHWEFAEPLPEVVVCDPVRLRQILLNLLANAVKFTPGGSVRLSVRAISAPVPGFEFTVTDTGPGIGPEHRASLFQPFARLGAAAGTEGTGLGLALVERLCVLMGGTVRYVETAAFGATFVVTLPLPVAVGSAPASLAQDNDPARLWSGLHILVAEDNSLVRELLVAFLTKQGARVVDVADGDAALVAADRETFSVVLLDWMMPHRDGLATARALRARTATGVGPFIIGLSAHAGADAFVEAHAAGMNAFLAKPVDLAALAHVIGQAPGVPALPLARLTTDAALIASLQARFAVELPVIAGEIVEAARVGNWARLQARAHYLKNSADLVGARGLGTVCQAVLATTAPPGPADVQTLAAGIVAASRHPFAPAPRSFATPAINEN